MAAVYPLNIDQGETFRLALTYANAPEAPGGTRTPIDLTGATAKMQIREKYASSVLVELTTENGGITIDGPSGVIHLLLTAVQTDALGHKDGTAKPREAAVYDLEVVLSGGDVKRVIQGAITINPNITREDAGTEGA